jgi:hypothetical protein
MPSAGLELATPATKRPQTYALDRAATEVGDLHLRHLIGLLGLRSSLLQDIRLENDAVKFRQIIVELFRV